MARVALRFLIAYRTSKAHTAVKALVGTLWGCKDGVPYEQAARLLKDLLKAAGIAPICTAYSIRHTLITELFNRGLKERG
jgi:site-specific recombinase XerD